MKTDDAYNVSIKASEASEIDALVLGNLLNIHINELEPGEEMNVMVVIKRGE